MTIKKITITGAAGNICYSLIFRILSKSVFAQNTRIQLSLLDIKETMSVLQGIKYEVEDCAFEVLDSIIITDNPEDAFSDSDFILLIGAKPRSEEMERSDLLLENANIFQQQAKSRRMTADPAVFPTRSADTVGTNSSWRTCVSPPGTSSARRTAAGMPP